MNKIIIGIIVLVIVGAGAIYFLQNPETQEDAMMENGDAMMKEDDGSVMEDGDSMMEGDSMMKDDGDAMMQEGERKAFTITGRPFEFSQDEIRVKKGDTIVINFSSTQGFHDWVVDEFDARTKQVRDTDASTSVEFVADKTGSFEFYCSVGNHREMGMVGTLIVE